MRREERNKLMYNLKAGVSKWRTGPLNHISLIIKAQNTITKDVKYEIIIPPHMASEKMKLK